MKTVTFRGTECEVCADRYMSSDRLAITLMTKEDGLPMARATVNMSEHDLKDDEVLIKDWSENEGMIEALADGKVIEKVLDEVQAGLTTAKKCRLSNEFMEEYEIESTISL